MESVSASTNASLSSSSEASTSTTTATTTSTTNDKEAGIYHHKFSKNDVMRIKQQWIDESDEEDADSSSTSSSKILSTAESSTTTKKKPKKQDWLLPTPSQRYKRFINKDDFDEEELLFLQSQLAAAKARNMKQQEDSFRLKQRVLMTGNDASFTRRVFDYTLATAKHWWGSGGSSRRTSDTTTPKMQEHSAEPKQSQQTNTAESPSNSNQQDYKRMESSDLLTHIEIEPEEEISNNFTSSMQERHTTTPFILTQPMMLQIANNALPTSVAFSKWKRLYSLVRDGDSFDTFLRNVKGHARTFLVIKTTTEKLFGCFADSPWEITHKHDVGHSFYGSAQAFLWRYSFDTDDIIIYKWTGRNRYIQFLDAATKLVAMGGGGDQGNFGLCIEDDFRRGSTGCCETFDNENLLGASNDDGQFNIMDLEVWGFSRTMF